jgi:hypothetical protein
MPLAPPIRHLYTGPAWEAARARVLARAKNACERCGRPNGAEVLTIGKWWFDSTLTRWRYPSPIVVAPDGSGVWFLRVSEPRDRGRFGIPPRCAQAHLQQVQIGVAHTNHTPGDYRVEILAAWCRWCHLDFDRPQHKRTRQERKDQKRPLLTAVTG